MQDGDIYMVEFPSKIKAADFPFTLIVEPNQTNNLTITSVALVFQLRAIDKKRLKNKIGRMEQIKLGLLKRALKEMMGLEQ